MASWLPSTSESLASTAMDTGVFCVVSAWSSAAVGAPARSVLPRTRKYRQIREAFIRRPKIERPAIASQPFSRHHQPIKPPAVACGAGIARLIRANDGLNEFAADNRVKAARIH